MCKNQDDDYNKYDDNRTFEEEIQEEFSKPIGKFENFYYNKPWRVILCTFIAWLVLFLVSWLLRNKGGIIVVFTYPVSLPFYAISLDIKKNMSERFARHNPIGFVILLWAAPIFLFILSLLGAEF